jgi:triosephosphate isomerase
MQDKPLIFAANWKMNHGPTAARGFMKEFVDQYEHRTDRHVFFFPPALSLSAAREIAADRADIFFGTQNIHWLDHGAFTGEISAPMARDAGADFTLVGHSERRHIFGETDTECADKCAAAERALLTPILCVGETLEERELGKTEGVVTHQLKVGLSQLAQCDLTTSVIAYEPVWAIGTGKTATPDDAAQIHTLLRDLLADLIGDRAQDVSILYGGSVKPDNVRELLDAPNVDGVLVGGASLKVDSWMAICEA